VLTAIYRKEQAAQLWQRDCAKLDAFLINDQHYSQNRAQNLILGASGAIYALYLKFLTQINIVAVFHRENVSFTRKTAN